MENNIIRSGSATYSILDEIEKSNHSVINLCTCESNGMKYCIKKSTKDDKASFQAEVKMLKMLSKSEYVVKLYDAFEIGSTRYVVTEYCEERDLFYYVEENCKIELEDALIIISKLINALNYLHSLGILHGDIKLENIFLKKSTDGHPNPVIGDFDYAVFLKNGECCRCQKGTLAYLPKLFLESTSHSFPIDVYGLGVCFEWIADKVQNMPEFVLEIIDYMKIECDGDRITIGDVKRIFDQEMINMGYSEIVCESMNSLKDEYNE